MKKHHGPADLTYKFTYDGNSIDFVSLKKNLVVIYGPVVYCIMFPKNYVVAQKAATFL